MPQYSFIIFEFLTGYFNPIYSVWRVQSSAFIFLESLQNFEESAKFCFKKKFEIGLTSGKFTNG